MKQMFWIVTFALCTSVVANAQTIADVARRERAKRQEPPRPRIATIEIVGKPAPPPEPPAAAKPGTTSNTPAADGAAASATASTPAAEAKQDGRDEKWWRGEFDKKRSDIRRGENQVAVAQLELNGANRDMLTRSYDPDGRGPAAVNAATAKLDAAQKYLESARGGLAQLEEDLRRAGLPAGWAR